MLIPKQNKVRDENYLRPCAVRRAWFADVAQRRITCSVVSSVV
jgi:hypothetical protein